MDIEDLNRVLFTLTESERLYRAGTVYDWRKAEGEEARTAVVDGRKMLRLGESVFRGNTNFWKKGEKAGCVPPLSGLFGVARNSRFNPSPEHVHSYMEMSYVYAGTCPQAVNGAPITLKENQVLLLDSNCPHAVGGLGQQSRRIQPLQQ